MCSLEHVSLFFFLRAVWLSRAAAQCKTQMSSTNDKDWARLVFARRAEAGAIIEGCLQR